MKVSKRREIRVIRVLLADREPCCACGHAHTREEFYYCARCDGRLCPFCAVMEAEEVTGPCCQKNAKET